MKLLSLLLCFLLAGSSAIAEVLIFHGSYTKKIGGVAAETEPRSGGAYFVYDTSNAAYRFITYYNHRAFRLKHQEDGAFGNIKRTTFPERRGRLLSVFSDAAESDGYGGYVHYLLKLDGIGTLTSDETVGNGFPRTLTGTETSIYGDIGMFEKIRRMVESGEIPRDLDY